MANKLQSGVWWRIIIPFSDDGGDSGGIDKTERSKTELATTILFFGCRNRDRIELTCSPLALAATSSIDERSSKVDFDEIASSCQKEKRKKKITLKWRRQRKVESL